jgi:hypothetical protein
MWKDMVSGEAYTNDMKKWEYERGERKKDIQWKESEGGRGRVDKGQGAEVVMGKEVVLGSEVAVNA